MSRLGFVLLASLAACDSQVDGDHQGTPLAQVGGSVRNERTQPVNDAEVVVLWQNTQGSPDLVAIDSVEVEGSFPAQFTLSIFEPPADTLLNDFNGVKVGVAYIVAGEVGTNYDSQDGAGVLGAEENHLLVYVPQGVPADSDASYILGGTPAPGFHIYHMRKLSETEQAERSSCVEGLSPDAGIPEIFESCGGFPQFDEFEPLETDLATPLDIELIDDLADLELPNWT
jgi:hypothetical protein